jgi:hypothetical protein
MVRLRGRAPRGVRVIGAVPLGRWQTITFVAALRYNKMVAPMVVEGAMTGEMFLAYVENCLVPMLRRNDIVVMDNCRVHLWPGSGRAIETVGATGRCIRTSAAITSIAVPPTSKKKRLRCGDQATRRLSRLCGTAWQFVAVLVVRKGPEGPRTLPHPITIARADTSRSNSWRPSRFRKGATAFSTQHAARL